MPPGRGRGRGGRGKSRASPFRRSGRPATRASSLAAASSQDPLVSNSDSVTREPSPVPQGGASASLDELRELMLSISDQLSTHHRILPAPTAPASLGPQRSLPPWSQSSSLL
uniref:Uncharacterized protein n=1 Tax=Amphimedon queenslandica TaxID=400682 RepID=A0A1X7TYA1_AMPQE